MVTGKWEQHHKLTTSQMLSGWFCCVSGICLQLRSSWQTLSLSLMGNHAAAPVCKNQMLFWRASLAAQYCKCSWRRKYAILKGKTALVNFSTCNSSAGSFNKYLFTVFWMCVYTQFGYKKWKGNENRSEENLDLHCGWNEYRCSFYHSAKFSTAYPVMPHGSCTHSIFDRQIGKAYILHYLLTTQQTKSCRQVGYRNAHQANTTVWFVPWTCALGAGWEQPGVLGPRCHKQ